MKTLSEILAEKVLAILAEQKLFVTDDAARYQDKFASGKMKAEDWRLAVEKAIDKDVNK
jgi:hypothetical protein